MAKGRILIVDDEEGPRESLRFILKDRCDVVTKSDGPSALETLRADGPYDVVLLDLIMPVMLDVVVHL